MDSTPLVFWGWDLFERGMLTIPALLAAALAIPILRTAIDYRNNAALEFLDAAGLAMVAAGFVGFGLWVAAAVWFESRTTIRDGVLTCGYTGGAYRLADFGVAELAEYRRGFGRRRSYAVVRVELAGQGGIRARCDTFIRPNDPLARELLGAVRARLAR